MDDGMVVDGQRVVFSSSEKMARDQRKAQLVVTSPPYWNLKNYGHPDQIGQEPYQEYLERLAGVWAACYEATTDNAVMVVNVANRRHKKRYYPIGMDIVATMPGWELWDHTIWYIPNALPQPNSYRERLLDNKYENLLVFIKPGRTDYTFHKPRVPQKYATRDSRGGKMNPQGRCLGNIIRVPAYRPPNVRQMGYHEAAFPEELVAFLVECYSDAGDVVLDPFLGSGTTLKVCKGMGRDGIGYEINPDAEELIRRRLAEPFVVPDWRELDLIHSSAADRTTPRRARA